MASRAPRAGRSRAALPATPVGALEGHEAALIQVSSFWLELSICVIADQQPIAGRGSVPPAAAFEKASLNVYA
jgi:hypothetical protein